MCGILGCVVNSEDKSGVIETLFDIFNNQKTRGQQGAGISINNSDSPLFRFRSVSPYRLFNVYNYQAWENFKQGSKVLVHHRYPTSSENKPKFNHPIATEDGKVHVIHNGILANEHELYRKLEGKHTFETKVKDSNRFTDTEVVVHVFEEAYQGKRKNIIKALEHVYRTVKGSFALAFNIEGEDRIYLMKNSMPIIISKDKDGNHYFSSEWDKKIGTKRIEELQRGEIGVLDSRGYHKIKVAEPDPDEKKNVEKIENTRKKWKKNKGRNHYNWDDNFGFVDYDSVPISSFNEERLWG